MRLKWNRNLLYLRGGTILFIVGFVPPLCLSSDTAAAGLILNAQLRFTYEDNVFGLLSDQQHIRTATGNAMPSMMMAPTSGSMGSMGGGKARYTGTGSGSQSPADFSGTLSAEAGGYQSLGASSEIFLKGLAEHTSYDYYTDLNSTIGGVITGIDMSFNDNMYARAAILGEVKRFGDSARDSTSYVGSLSLKEKITPLLWVREAGTYEKNNADSPLFTYIATTIGINSGYRLSNNTLLTLGYSYLVEMYEDPSGTAVRANTVFLGAEHKLTKSWAIAGEYDLQISTDSTTATSTTDNIFSLALRYSY
jgi:hypothetical protein